MTKWYTCLFGHSWSRWKLVNITRHYPDRDVETTKQQKECAKCGLRKLRNLSGDLRNTDYE